eukprot:gnl/Dysnectes_brevis/2665_a3225_950.p1 GENE.gnl/Dysnectes_brevis/2665_a3225_950~~gnl/Dysnectes_brevis/2665_a3225_950.p1  ORF type:complete len:388 (-),score=107.64 gnl/Dysnectes_brevis/2665_a3225_950:22-1185(-)
MLQILFLLLITSIAYSILTVSVDNFFTLLHAFNSTVHSNITIDTIQHQGHGVLSTGTIATGDIIISTPLSSPLIVSPFSFASTTLNTTQVQGLAPLGKQAIYLAWIEQQHTHLDHWLTLIPTCSSLAAWNSHQVTKLGAHQIEMHQQVRQLELDILEAAAGMELELDPQRVAFWVCSLLSRNLPLPTAFPVAVPLVDMINHQEIANSAISVEEGSIVVRATAPIPPGAQVTVRYQVPRDQALFKYGMVMGSPELGITAALSASPLRPIRSALLQALEEEGVTEDGVTVTYRGGSIPLALLAFLRLEHADPSALVDLTPLSPLPAQQEMQALRALLEWTQVRRDQINSTPRDDSLAGSLASELHVGELGLLDELDEQVEQAWIHILRN